MMNRCPDVMFMAEYIKNVLYFATVRQGKSLKNTADTHYFCIDNDLVYENYYSDFGPLNLGCVYRYCRILNEKINLYLNKQTIVHYTSIDPKKKANSAFLLGCYGVLYLSLTPRDALKPLLAHGQNYRPFQDATQGDSAYTISLIDCLHAIKKARELGFFNFQDFNYEEYEKLDKIQGGDLNWIVPGKFLAFIGPVDYSVSLYHPPEMYIDYFLENDVRIVIRLNKRLYDGNVFNNVGIVHYDLFFPDGSCPPRHILFKFLQISEEATSSIAVHCKAGLGRTGSLIGCYLIKHYKMTSHEAIGWMRICRPGSVIGHQQGWLEQLEPWLIKQGNIYRKHKYQDTDKLPYHEFGIYSIAEKTTKQRPVVFQKTPSPPPPLQKQSVRMNDLSTPSRPQNSRIKEDKSVEDRQDWDTEYEAEKEVCLGSCDLTIQPIGPMKQLKGCVLKTSNEECNERDLYCEKNKKSCWKKYFCCQPCFRKLNDGLFMLAVRCASVAPDKSLNKAAEKERDWRMKLKSLSNSQSTPYRGTPTPPQRTSGAGDPKAGRPTSRNSTTRSSAFTAREHGKPTFLSKAAETTSYRAGNTPITTFRTSQAPIIKTLNDARNYLMRSSIYNTEREKYLNSSLTVTPQTRAQSYLGSFKGNSNITPTSYNTSSYNTTPRPAPQPLPRRRLGRSPSPPSRMSTEQTRATNTPSPTEKFLVKDASKSALKDVLSRLKLATCRDGSLGAASLGANRDAPAPRRAPSVRSDERPLATQGDMLNSIKFQRRLRDTLTTPDKSGFHDTTKTSLAAKKPSIKNITSRTNNANKSNLSQNQGQVSNSKDKPNTTARSFFNPPRPMSPKGRRNSQASSFY
ncbi:uncharacterized protein LOC142982704 isoform X2 [Anticarsia gemmatalis]|uniref:uncharacterized protein LOC142982704 isoform X2 n=1 Tax=Anticarsia gemmatalis TaxID=129554 RepID=UPI003F767E1E